VLIVAYHFPPEASIGTHRTLRLVRQLAERGWDVTVLTGTRATYSSGCSIDLDLLTRVPETVRVVRAPVLRPVDRMSDIFKRFRHKGRAEHAAAAAPAQRPARSGDARTALGRGRDLLDGLLRIPDAHVGWMLPAIAAGTLTAGRRWPDVLYSTAPPWTGQLVARTLAGILNCPWVADFRDPWARAPWRERRLPAARRAAEVMERSVIRRADAVVFTTQTNLDEYERFYRIGSGRKFRLVRNGCDRQEFNGLTTAARDSRFTLLHAGSLYGGRKPTALFAALAALRDRGVISADMFCFRQIGRVGLSDFDMAAERDRLGLQGLVELSAALPRREILRQMVSASCLLLLQPGTTVSIPGKLFEYFAAGRPVLGLAEEGETSDLIRASGGIAVLADDRAAIEAAIERLVRNGHSLSEQPSPDLYDGALRTRELVAVLESMLPPAVRDVPDLHGIEPGGMAP
jgi:glycosyltransferase involved in cell wall biosynthesis